MTSLFTRGDYRTAAVHSNSVHHYHKKTADMVIFAVEVGSGESWDRKELHKMDAMTLMARPSVDTLSMKASSLLPRLTFSDSCLASLSDRMAIWMRSELADSGDSLGEDESLSEAKESGSKV